MMLISALIIFILALGTGVIGLVAETDGYANLTEVMLWVAFTCLAIACFTAIVHFVADDPAKA